MTILNIVKGVNIDYNELDLQIIIPVLNEEGTICSVIDKCRKFTNNILVVDGRSNDNTVKLAEDMGAKVLVQDGRGKGAAIREAFQHVEGDIVVMLDADGSMRPEEIPIFLDRIVSGADIVKGSRMVPYGDSNDITMLRRFGNFVFILIVNVFLKTNYTDLCYGYMAFRKNAVMKLLKCLQCDGFNIETEIVMKGTKMGLNIVEVPSFELKRDFGVSKLNTILDGGKIFMTILKNLLV